MRKQSQSRNPKKEVAWCAFNFPHCFLSAVQFPIAIQRCPLDFPLVQQQIERGHHGFWSLPQLFRQIAFADDHISSRKSLVYVAGVNRNPLAKSPEFAFPLSLRTFGP